MSALCPSTFGLLTHRVRPQDLIPDRKQEVVGADLWASVSATKNCAYVHGGKSAKHSPVAPGTNTSSGLSFDDGGTACPVNFVRTERTEGRHRCTAAANPTASAAGAVPRCCHPAVAAAGRTGAVDSHAGAVNG